MQHKSKQNKDAKKQKNGVTDSFINHKEEPIKMVGAQARRRKSGPSDVPVVETNCSDGVLEQAQE
jgi:hypothetical protein